ncbi:MAG: hypothetical protein WC030_02295 [Candidatus Paceibacterota bacterium]
MDIEQWRKQLKELSGNLTTNTAMPPQLAEKLLEEDISLKEKLSFTEVTFPKFNGALDRVDGLQIIAGLQSKSGKPGCLTLFRAIRFPTYKRMHELVYEGGYVVSNYEQERILELYKDQEYIQKREEMRGDERFWTQPQERVVHGLPLFSLVNDALQIHRAYRGDDDLAVIVALHIPHELFEDRRIKLVANTAIDLDYQNGDRDFEIQDFKRDGDVYEIDYGALRARGIDLHEMYTRDLPLDPNDIETLGITQDFYLLNIYKITDYAAVTAIFNDTALLKSSRHFLHGFFGDQNIFGRRRSYYLPYKCQKIAKTI